MKWVWDLVICVGLFSILHGVVHRKGRASAQWDLSHWTHPGREMGDN